MHGLSRIWDASGSGVVMQLLPDMSYIPPPGVEVSNCVLGVLFVLATFTERRAAVEVLRSSPNAFEREPYERHQIKLEEAGRKLVAAADGVDWRLSIDLGYMQDLPECQTVSDFLRSLHHDPGRGSFNQGCEAQRYGDGSGSGGYRDIRLSGPGFREEVMPSVRCDARVADSHPAHVAAALKAIGAETLS